MLVKKEREAITTGAGMHFMLESVKTNKKRDVLGSRDFFYYLISPLIHFFDLDNS